MNQSELDGEKNFDSNPNSVICDHVEPFLIRNRGVSVLSRDWPYNTVQLWPHNDKIRDE